MRAIGATVLGGMVLAAGIQPAVGLQTADGSNAGRSQSFKSLPADSTTQGAIDVGGQHIAYTAIAGTITVGSTDVQDAQLGIDCDDFVKSDRQVLDSNSANTDHFEGYYGVICIDYTVAKC